MSRIITQIKQVPNTDNWILQLNNAITNPSELLTLLDLDPNLLPVSAKLAKQQFSLRVPQPFINRMEKGNWNDPLLLQVLNSEKELLSAPGFSQDPLKEHSSVLPGLLHKYRNRALFITKTGCAINCRYCFRRQFPYAQNQGTKKNWREAIEYLQFHPKIDEIILSGGDPLMAKDKELDWLISELDSIKHIKRLRIHTRLAVVIPERITDWLCNRLATSRLQMILVTHINHPNEIDEPTANAMAKLKKHGVTLFNQSVLLRAINDDVATLSSLSNRLFDIGIIPYYLHVLDKIQGASHFLVTDQKAKALMNQLSKNLSGYLLPKLCREIGGEKSKTLLHY